MSRQEVGCKLDCNYSIRRRGFRPATVLSKHLSPPTVYSIHGQTRCETLSRAATGRGERFGWEIRMTGRLCTARSLTSLVLVPTTSIALPGVDAPAALIRVATGYDRETGARGYADALSANEIVGSRSLRTCTRVQTCAGSRRGRVVPDLQRPEPSPRRGLRSARAKPHPPRPLKGSPNSQKDRSRRRIVTLRGSTPTRRAGPRELPPRGS